MEEKNSTNNSRDMIPENWEEVLDLDLDIDHCFRLFPKSPDRPEFPYAKGRIIRYLVELLKYLEKTQPRVQKLSEIDKEEAGKIMALYIQMARHVATLTAEWINLLDKDEYEANRLLKETHPIYTDFIKNSFDLQHMYTIARERLRNCAIVTALECEQNGPAEDCSSEGTHFCFLNNVG